MAVQAWCYQIDSVTLIINYLVSNLEMVVFLGSNIAVVSITLIFLFVSVKLLRRSQPAALQR